MQALYVFAHPDDESFGPARAMSKQRRQGHEVYLLTLTRGGATRQRHKYGYSIAEMGEVRYKEMLDVAKVLDMSGMTVLDLPDSGLKEMDPREIERVVAEHIQALEPQVVVTDAVHGIRRDIGRVEDTKRRFQGTAAGQWGAVVVHVCMTGGAGCGMEKILATLRGLRRGRRQDHRGG